MRVSANGYDRNHGIKEIVECELNLNPQTVNATSLGIQILVPASITLNGKYLLRIEIPQSEVSRLFYMTHRDKGLRDIVGILTEFKEEEDRVAEAEAQREAARKQEVIKRRKI